MRERKSILVLILILVLGFSIRLSNLDNRGFWHWDEAWYLLEARFTNYIIKNGISILQKVKNHEITTQELINTIPGYPPFTPKPLYSTVIAVISLLTGIKLYIFQFINTLYDIFLIFLIYKFCVVILRDRKTGLFSSLVSSLFLYQIIYARSLYSETLSMLLIFISIFVLFQTFQKEKLLKRDLFLSGFLLGIAFTTNYKVLINIFFLVPLIVFHLLYIKHLTFKKVIVLLLFYLFGISIFVVLFQLPYFIAKLFITLPEKIMSYWGMIFGWYTHQTPGINKEISLFYISLLTTRYMFHLCGILINILMITGLIMLIKSKKILTEKYIFISYSYYIVITFYLIFTLKSNTTPARAFSGILPFICIVSGWTLNKIVQKFSCKYIKIGIITCFVLYNMYIIYPVLQLEKPYKPIIDYIKSNADKHISTTTAISRYYTGRNKVFLLPYSVKDLKELLKKENIEYIFYVPYPNYFTYESVDYLFKNYKPVKTNNYQHVKYYPFIYEDLLYGIDIEKRIDKLPAKVYLFKIAKEYKIK